MTDNTDNIGHWEHGYVLAKYDSFKSWPPDHADAINDWLDGFCIGCIELAQYKQWQSRLSELTPPDYILNAVNAPYHGEP